MSSAPVAFSAVGVSSPVSAPAPKVFTTAWREEWTSCFDDGEACVLSTFCPCVQFAKNYVAGSTPGYGAQPDQLVSQNMGLACGACVVYAGGMYLCFNAGMGVMGCVGRGAIRQKYSINTGDCADPCSDCLLHTFCTCCALSQEWRELKFRADQPATITMPGGAIVGTVVASPGVVVLSSPVYVSPPQCAQCQEEAGRRAQPMSAGQPMHPQQQQQQQQQQHQHQSPPAYAPQGQQQQQYPQPQPQAHYAAQPHYATPPPPQQQQPAPQAYVGQPQYAAQPVQFAPQGQPQYTPQPQYAPQQYGAPQQQMQR